MGPNPGKAGALCQDPIRSCRAMPEELCTNLTPPNAHLSSKARPTGSLYKIDGAQIANYTLHLAVVYKG